MIVIFAISGVVALVLVIGFALTEELESPFLSGLFDEFPTSDFLIDENTGTRYSRPTEVPERYMWVLDAGDLLGEYRVIKLTTAGERVWEVSFGQSESFGLSPSDGSLWVPDIRDQFGNEAQLIKLDNDGYELFRLSGYLTDILAVNPLGGGVWVSLPNDDTIVFLDHEGRELNWAYGFEATYAIVVDPRDGSVIVADGGGDRGPSITKLNPQGEQVFRIGTPGFFSNSPQQIAIDPFDGSVWYSGARSGQVFKASSEGEGITSTGGFEAPVSISLHPVDGSVWIADFSVQGSGGVVKLDALGNLLTRVVLETPPTIASVDPLDGSVWVGYEGRLVKLGAEGEILMILEDFTHPKAIIVEPVQVDLSSRPQPVIGTPLHTPTVSPRQVLRQIPLPSEANILDILEMGSDGEEELIIYTVSLNAQSIRDFYTYELPDLSWERVFSDEGMSTATNHLLPTAGLDFRRGEEWLSIAVVEDMAGLIGEHETETSAVFAATNMTSGEQVIAIALLMQSMSDELNLQSIDVNPKSMRFLSDVIEFDHPANWVATRGTINSYTTDSEVGQAYHNLEFTGDCPTVDAECFVNFYILENVLYEPPISIRKHANPEGARLEDFEQQHWGSLLQGAGAPIESLDNVVRPEQLAAAGSLQSLELNTITLQDGSQGLQRIYRWEQTGLSISLVSSYTLFSQDDTIYEFRSDFTEEEWGTYQEMMQGMLATIEFPVEEINFVCAAYVRTAGSIDYLKHMWTGDAAAIDSLRGCFEWAERNILNENQCGRPAGERAIIALLDIKRLYNEVPDDLDMSTEFVTGRLCPQ
jgi:hypothetical protein